MDSWVKLIADYESMIGKKYPDDIGNEFVFAGLLHGEDDYYFLMLRGGEARLLSCVGAPEQMGFSSMKRVP